MHPPRINGNTYLRQKLRFTPSASLTNYPISPQNIMESLGIIATSATIGYCIFGSFRIKEIEMWCAQTNTAGAVLATCAVSFPLGTSFQSNREFSDSSMSPAYPAHIRVRPPGNEYAAFWQTHTGNGYFAFSCTQNTIIDIDVECVLRDGTSNIPSTIALVAATTGAVYYQPLDGTGGVILPVSRTKI